MQAKQSLIHSWESSGTITDRNVIEAFRKVPREKFILRQYLPQAYSDHPLPIGHGQSISQPTTVMIMTEALEVRKNSKVLEIGTGSGYQAAIISMLTSNKVITTEIVAQLAEYAKKNLKPYGNVAVVNADGSTGYGPEAPYDRIIITAACPKIPGAIIAQLRINGIIIAPVGDLYSQKMIKLIKEKDGVSTRSLGDFVFVPLKGHYGFTSE